MSCTIPNQKYLKRKREIKVGNKSFRFARLSDETAFDSQINEINRLLYEVIGKDIFNPKTIDEYLYEFLVRIGRTEFDLTKKPLTGFEAQMLINDLKKKERLIKSKNYTNKLFNMLQTPEKVFEKNSITEKYYKRFNEEMHSSVKRNITIWNKLIDGEGPVLLRKFDIEKNKSGELNIKFLGTEKTRSFKEILELDDNSLKKLKEWSNLKFKLYSQAETYRQEIESIVSELKNNKSLSKQDKAEMLNRIKYLNDEYKRTIEPVKEFEKTIPDLVQMSKLIRKLIESKDESAKKQIRKQLSKLLVIDEKKVELFEKNWRSMMNDLFLFERETYNKWIEGEVTLLDGTKTTYRKLAQKELEIVVTEYFISKGENVKDPKVKEQIEKIVKALSPDVIQFRVGYFPHILASQKFTSEKSFVYSLINDIKTGRVDIDALLSMQSVNNHWIRREADDNEIIEDPFTILESRVLAAIQTRKNLALRSLTIETVKNIQIEKQRLENFKYSNVSQYKEWVKSAFNLIKQLEYLEHYIRVLSSDAQGIERGTLIGNIYNKLVFSKNRNDASFTPAEIDMYVASASRVFRALKVSAYIGFSVKSAMNNLQQQVGAVITQYGIKYWKNVAPRVLFSKSGRDVNKRVYIDSNGNEREVDIVEALGVNYDDIMSAIERGLDPLERQLEKDFIRNKKFARYVEKIERAAQALTQVSLENSYLGKIISFVETEYKNRQVNGLVAYDYYFDLFKKQGKKEHEAHALAIKFAREDVSNLQFEYSVFNRPEFGRRNLSSIFFLFKSFAVNQYNLLGKWVVEAKRGVIKNEDGVTINIDQLQRVFRLSMMLAIRGSVAKVVGYDFAILGVAVPFAEQAWDLINLILADTDKEKRETFYGLGEVGALTSVMTGPQNDLLFLLMLNGAPRETKALLWDSIVMGYIPGGRDFKSFIGTANPYIKDDTKKRRALLPQLIFNEMYHKDRSLVATEIGSKIALDIITGRKLYYNER
jgi:hypothetical protein